MKVQLVKVSDLTPARYRSLVGLNMRGEGLMQRMFQKSYNNDGCVDYTKDFVAFLKVGGIVVSWAFTFKRGPHRYIHAYTRCAARGKGYAGKVISKIIDNFPNEKIHCQGEPKFFARYNIGW